MSEWISVKDKLPECNNKYGDEDTLVCMNDEFIATACFVKKEGWWELWADAGEVIAWMPLPKPYKEKKLEKSPALVWERIINPYGDLEGFICVCGHQSMTASNYCPNCGRRMESE